MATSVTDIYLEWKNVEVFAKDIVRYDGKIKEPADNIKVKGKPFKRILKGVNGFAKPKELVGIIGPSGAGKTTLLEYLGKKLPITPDIFVSEESKALINGATFDKNLFNSLGSFIQQDDYLYEMSSPAELFEFSAKLRTNLPSEERRQRVEYYLEVLGLTSCRDVPVGGYFIKGCSGGERKRTSIGFELITKPRIVFLDEPTSGLDSHTALNTVRYLKKIAMTDSATLICTIHQPSSQMMQYFDRFICLADG